jgi:hypothetical protein
MKNSTLSACAANTMSRLIQIILASVILISLNTSSGRLVLSDNLYTSTLNIENLRIVRKYASTVVIQCPLTTVRNEIIRPDQIRWINENNDYNKPDHAVVLSQYNVIDQGKVNILANERYYYISCGYCINNMYIRLKMWRFIYVGNYSLKKKQQQQ